MLPFLDKKKLSSTIISLRTKEGKTVEHPENEAHPELLKAADMLIGGINAKDAQKIAEAMQMAHVHLNKDKPDASE